MLFDNLPIFPVALPDDELHLLSSLAGCDWPTRQEIGEAQHAAARRLEEKGLIKVSRQTADPVADWPTWYVGKLSASRIREA